jgi:CMP-N,N'-diacetyllegionaminic acid synthase
MPNGPILAIIPARGGSKGIPRKNVYPLAGQPLIVHTIAQALAACHVDRVVVSTDDDEIAAISLNAGAHVVRRPAEISGDTASSESALLHSLAFLQATEQYQPSLVVFLQCTSPLRQPDDIDGAIQTLRDRQADSVLSVSPSHRFLWVEKDGQARPLNYDCHSRPRRQDMEAQYVENGSIYVTRTGLLRETGNRLGGRIALHIMDEEAALDIDSVVDLTIAEALMRERILQIGLQTV